MVEFTNPIHSKCNLLLIMDTMKILSIKDKPCFVADGFSCLPGLPRNRKLEAQGCP